MKKFLFCLLAAPLWISGCVGIHYIPLTDDEAIELQFDGPVTLSYRLQDGSTETVVVEQSLELSLRNRYDDGDPTTTAKNEKFLSYFRLDAEGGAIHLGMDPEALHPINGDPMFPAAAIAEYAATAQFELEGQATLLDPAAPLRMTATFLAAVAQRREFACVDSTGSTVFVYDPQTIQLCRDPNHSEVRDSRKDYVYDRATILSLTQNNQHAMLGTYNPDHAEEPPLVLKIVNTSYQAPVQEEADSAGTPGSGGTSPATESGGCSLAMGNQGNHGQVFGWMGVLILGWLRARRG